jgi:hypothetical protein
MTPTTVVPQTQTTASQPSQPPPPQQQSDQGSVPTSTGDAISKGMGSVFGSFGKKKKQHDQNAADSSNSAQQSGSTTGALMEMQIEVTQYSNSSVDRGLFDIPAGYTQVQQDPNQLFGAPRRQ